MQKPNNVSSEDWKRFLDEMEEIQSRDTLGSKEGTRTQQGPGFEFNMKPEELESYLNQFVINQQDAVEILATKICTHFNRMKLEKISKLKRPVVGNIKNNILMIGPTGVGKTYIIKLIADKIGVPFVKADATKFTETGYVGGDVEDLVRDLVHAADGNISEAEYGIIYIDEIDKIASSRNSIGPDVSRSGVQRNLLKIMEESEVNLRTPHDLASQMEAAMQAQKTGKIERKVINTKNILFIVSGAFSGLEKIIEKRLNRTGIGFNAIPKSKETYSSEIFRLAKNEDFMEYGFESEFIGRLPVVSVLDPLDVDGLFKILKNENSSVILSKIMDFAAYGIDITFTDGALLAIAEKAALQKTGARGLTGVIEKILVKFEKKLPSTAVKEFVVDELLLANPDEALTRLINESVFLSFSENFFEKHGIKLQFSEKAEEIIRQTAEKKNESIADYIQNLFQDYAYGLKLIQADSMTIDENVALDPEKYLNELIKQNYNLKKQSENK